MKKITVKSAFRIIILLAGTASAQFFTDTSEYRNLAQDNYVDVVYEYTPHDSGNAGTFSSGKLLNVAKGFWDQSEAARRHVVCKSRRYQVIANLERPQVDALMVGDVNFLSEAGLVIEVEDANGTLYRSNLSPVKARQNTWRAGYTYDDAHLLDFQLATLAGEVLPLTAELVLHAYPDKVHIEARLTLKEPIDLRRAALVCHFEQTPQPLSHGWLIREPQRSDCLAVWGGKLSDKQITVTLQKDKSSDRLLTGHLAFFPGTDMKVLDESLQQEAQPLGPEAFQVINGLFLGYDAAKGFYRFRNIHGLSAGHFTSFHRNPNMYLSTGIKINNNALDRRIYVKHSAGAGAIESAVLTDETGFPLAVPVQCAKNFGGEKEEPDDSAFSESYFPLPLKAWEKKIIQCTTSAPKLRQSCSAATLFHSLLSDLLPSVRSSYTGISNRKVERCLWLLQQLDRCS